MRDSKRIKEVLNKIEDFWERNPYMRLGQVISNCVRSFDGRINCDPFYIEDYELLEGLEELDKYLRRG